jgi:hypothetical protein
MAFLVKIRDGDPLQSWKARQFIEWWLKDLRSQLRRSLRGRHISPPDLVLAELCGALAGLFGGYRRSLRRVERIRRQFAA